MQVTNVCMCSISKIQRLEFKDGKKKGKLYQRLQGFEVRKFVASIIYLFLLLFTTIPSQSGHISRSLSRSVWGLTLRFWISYQEEIVVLRKKGDI